MIATLIDTNILVYAYIAQESDLRVQKSKSVIEDLIRDGSAVVAIQNLTEFSRVCLSKYRAPVNDVRDRVNRMRQTFNVVLPTQGSVDLALLAVERHQLSFWDAMLWAVAKENGVPEILTEDFQHGQIVDGVAYRNPLKTGAPGAQ